MRSRVPALSASGKEEIRSGVIQDCDQRLREHDALALLVGRLPWDLVSWRGDPRAPRCPMSRHRKDPLRPLAADERQELTRLSRSLSAPAAQVERSRALLAIADGASYTAAAHQVGTAHRDHLGLGQPLQPRRARGRAAGPWGWRADPLWG